MSAPQPPAAGGDDWMVAPCGCGFGVVGEAFVIEPCSLTCEVYLYAVQQSRLAGRPVSYVDAS